MTLAKLGAFAVMLAIVLSACGPRYTVGNKTFSSKDESLAHVQTSMEAKLPKQDPLPSPIAGPVVVLIPTDEHFRATKRSQANPGQEELLEFVAKGDYIIARHIVDVIAHRNIFESMDVVRADTPDGVSVPADGYLLWFETHGHRGQFHIAAHGEAETTLLGADPSSAGQKVTGAEATKRLLGSIESYVRTHPPSP